MGRELVRFGVAMERSLLEHFDIVVSERGVTRSEVLRDLVRAEIVRAQVAKGVLAVATLTLVYDHHVRELTEKITEFQHQLGDQVRSTLHVHLDAHRCLEDVVMHGRSDELKRIADRLLATRGVTHGGIEIISDTEDHGHEHDHDHGHAHGPTRTAEARKTPGSTRRESGAGRAAKLRSR
jgi:CopG family nickel-responsive transcriptional regulator